MRTADLKKSILKLFRGKELYGYDINKILADQGIEVDLSRLYAVLNDMRKEGILNDRWEKSSSGPRKKMYKISDKGNEMLNEILLEAIATVHSFYGDYLRSLYPEINVFGEIIGLLSENMKDDENIAYVTTKYFDIHELLLGILHKQNINGTTYLIKPRNLKIETKLEGINILEGSYTDLPFKDNHIHRLLLIDLPGQETINESTKEWHRVLAKEGRLTIITPSILIDKQIHPLSIGDFVEKQEHEVIEHGQHVDREILLSSLEPNFMNIIENESVHMSVITAFSD
jgi:PadR family transcriptional regulator PadR